MNNQNSCYSNATSTTSWTDDGIVQDGNKSVYSLLTDSLGNVYAGIGDNGEVNKKRLEVQTGFLLSPQKQERVLRIYQTDQINCDLR